MADSTRVETHIGDGYGGSPTRPTGAIIQEVVSHIEEIIRSEVRLAKTEVKEEATKAARAGMMLGGAAVVGLFAAACLLGACVAALAMVIPVWAALLSMGVLCAIIAGGALSAGLARLKRVRPLPQRTVQTLRDDVSWLKSRT